MSTQARKPAGSAGSTGGQFAPHRAGEASVDLAPAQWVQDGVTPHPSGGYVIVDRSDSDISYHDNRGRRHRLDGPAIEDVDGSKEWWVAGRLHRLDGPAVDYTNGCREWWANGRRHRADGPAFEAPDGREEWWVNGRRHRADGPAVERPDGMTEYWVDGCQLTQAEFEALPPA